MPYHRLVSTLFGGVFCSLAYLGCGLLGQARTLAWYSQATALLAVELIIAGAFYRLVFHPLAKYPGPLIGCLTDWYSAYWLVHGGRHLNFHNQHKKYGKYVRYGPNRLSINSVGASRDLHDVKANVCKGNAYGAAKIFFGQEMSMSTQDVKSHAFRRRVNVAAITSTAIKDFEELVTPHVDLLMNLVGQGAGVVGDGEAGWTSGRDMSSYFGHCIADMMGSVTFNRSWETQKEEKYRHFVKGSPDGVCGIHLVGHLQYLCKGNLHKLLFKELVDGIGELTSVSRDFATWRMNQTDLKHRDIWAALLGARDPKTGVAFNEEQLISEAGLFIVGGTDGVITAISATLFYLLHNPRALARLTKEVRDTFPLAPEHHGKRAADVPRPIQFCSPELSKLTYLLSCMDEAMRLSPPVPSILPRMVRAGGIFIDGEYFPEGVQLGIPHYSLQRTEEYYPRPNEYIPERWIASERKKGTAPVGAEPSKLKPGAGQAPAFTPFGAGRASCIGKTLAYQEISLMLARLVWLYDMRIEPGNVAGEGTGGEAEGRGCKNEYQLSDRFVSKQEGPVVQFRYREELRA